MIFSEEFIDNFRSEPIKYALEIGDVVKSGLSTGRGWTVGDLNLLTEAYALLVEAMEADILPIKTIYPDISGEHESDCQSIKLFVSEVVALCKAEETRLRVESLRSKFKTSLGSSFTYEFSQGDLERVQILINKLRSEISELNELDGDHKKRLLNRLEKLQSELHKKMSDLDRFWGLVGDAGVVLGKLGNDAKPMVDRVKEIAKIVWQTQSRAEELPSGTQLPFLEDKQD